MDIIKQVMESFFLPFSLSLSYSVSLLPTDTTKDVVYKVCVPLKTKEKKYPLHPSPHSLCQARKIK